jgi:SRSO17 transposase
VKKGRSSAGVQRQYSGTAGKVDNCQLGVFLAYASSAGRAFIDRELYLPASWTSDRPRCRAAGVPEEVGFQTKPQLARMMLERALDAGVPAAWVTADEVYGGDPTLRGWLEDRGVAYVLAIKRTEPLAAATTGTVRVPAEELAAQIPAERWLRCSAGHGAKGRRFYDWARLELAEPGRTGWGRWLLVRRHVDDPAELAFYLCWARAATPLMGLVRVAGARWVVEEGFAQGKGQVGLDHYEVRRYSAWYRHVTLALLAHAFLAVTRAIVAKGKGAAVASAPDRGCCR